MQIAFPSETFIKEEGKKSIFLVYLQMLWKSPYVKTMGLVAIFMACLFFSRLVMQGQKEVSEQKEFFDLRAKAALNWNRFDLCYTDAWYRLLQKRPSLVKGLEAELFQRMILEEKNSPAKMRKIIQSISKNDTAPSFMQMAVDFSTGDFAKIKESLSLEAKKGKEHEELLYFYDLLASFTVAKKMNDPIALKEASLKIEEALFTQKTLSPVTQKTIFSILQSSESSLRSFILD